MEGVRMCSWIENNLYWLVPTICTIVLTIFLIRISCKQNDLQKQSIQLTLYEKRFQLYSRRRETLFEFLSFDSDQTMSAYIKMGGMRDEFYFLFGEEIAKYYTKIINSAHVITNKNNFGTVDFNNARDWLMSQIMEEKEMRKQFEKYLCLRESGLSS
jgi:hypothetical protein